MSDHPSNPLRALLSFQIGPKRTHFSSGSTYKLNFLWWKCEMGRKSLGRESLEVGPLCIHWLLYFLFQRILFVFGGDRVDWMGRGRSFLPFGDDLSPNKRTNGLSPQIWILYLKDAHTQLPVSISFFLAIVSLEEARYSKVHHLGSPSLQLRGKRGKSRSFKPGKHESSENTRLLHYSHSHTSFEAESESKRKVIPEGKREL